MDLLGSKDMRADAADNRLEQPGRLADPVAQGGAVEFQALPGVNLALPIKRQMVAIFCHQQMREHRRRRAAARGRHRGRGCLADRIAGAAGIFRSHVADHLEVPRHVIQHLRHILAEHAHPAATGRAHAGGITGGLMHHFLPRQVIGQRFAFRLFPLSERSGGSAGRARSART